MLGHLQVINYSIINIERKHIREIGLPKVVLICVIQRDLMYMFSLTVNYRVAYDLKMAKHGRNM